MIESPGEQAILFPLNSELSTHTRRSYLSSVFSLMLYRLPHTPSHQSLNFLRLGLTPPTARTMSTATHNYKPRAGFDDSGASGLYHSARPNYPEASMQAILEAAQAGKSSPPLLNILEIGSGTGISTESLLREAGETKLKILKYLAVEPSKGMRLRRFASRCCRSSGRAASCPTQRK